MAISSNYKHTCIMGTFIENNRRRKTDCSYQKRGRLVDYIKARSRSEANVVFLFKDKIATKASRQL